MYYFPVAVVALVSHVWLLSKASGLSKTQKSAVKTSLVLFLIVLVLTVFVIVFINVPVIDQGNYGSQLPETYMTLWAFLNLFRIILPAWGILRLSQLVTLKT